MCSYCSLLECCPESGFSPVFGMSWALLRGDSFIHLIIFILGSLSVKAPSSKAPFNFIKKFNLGHLKKLKSPGFEVFLTGRNFRGHLIPNLTASMRKTFCICSQIFLRRMKAKFSISRVMIMDRLHCSLGNKMLF